MNNREVQTTRGLEIAKYLGLSIDTVRQEVLTSKGMKPPAEIYLKVREIIRDGRGKKHYCRKYRNCAECPKYEHISLKFICHYDIK